MFIYTILLLLLLSSAFITIIQCQDTNIETIQTTCFNDISIFKSNSPHNIQKNGDRICVNHKQDISTDNSHYQKLMNEEINSTILPRSINFDNSVSPLFGTPTNLSIYQANSSVFRFISSTNTTSYFTLPVQLFNNPTCSGSQPITYLNDFTSTCSQSVSATTCGDALDSTKYSNNSFCLIQNPSTLAGTNPSSICCTGNVSTSTWTSPTCQNAVQNLNMIIFYLNPGGIQSCSISLTTMNAANTLPLQQTFSVRFLKVGSSSSPITSRSGNPGYILGFPILAGNSVGNTITPTSGLTILQIAGTGLCSNTNNKFITFGQNIQSTCLFSGCPNITDPTNIFTPYTTNNLYVGVYGSSDSSNITNWLPVTFCTSIIGSTNGRVCQTNSVPSSSGQCYTRLDIQIVYANFGSVTNPQSIIGGVIYHFQSVTTTSATTVLITQTVTFQDMSKSPTTEGDHIPRPNVRLPGDFFYPFSLSRATNPIVFSLSFYFLIVFLLFLM